MKQLTFNEQDFEAERIVKFADSIIGFTSNVEVFAFRGISDFKGFALLNDAEFDMPEPTDKERIEQLENMILMMMEVM